MISQGFNGNVFNKSTSYAYSGEVDQVEKENKTARLEFDTKDMRRFTKDRGIKVLWERAYFCTCLNPETGSPRLDCPRCHGKGIAYLPAEETHMMIQSQEKGTQNIDIGLVDTGTAIGTTKLETTLPSFGNIRGPYVLKIRIILIRILF